MDLQAYIDLGSWFCDKNCGWPFNFTDSFFESSFSTWQNVSFSSVSAECFPRSANSSSKCLLLNTRGICNKINDLNALLLMNSSDIIALTETWLDSNFNDRDLHLRTIVSFFGIDVVNVVEDCYSRLNHNCHVYGDTILRSMRRC